MLTTMGLPMITSMLFTATRTMILLLLTALVRRVMLVALTVFLLTVTNNNDEDEGARVSVFWTRKHELADSAVASGA